MKLKDNLNDVELYDYYGNNIISFRKGYTFHHINGPSYINSTGLKRYWINDLFHNAKGAAVIRTDGKEYYYLDGELLSEKEWHDKWITKKE